MRCTALRPLTPGRRSRRAPAQCRPGPRPARPEAEPPAVLGWRWPQAVWLTAGGTCCFPGPAPRVANSTWFAGRAMSVLSAPEFTGAFSNRDYRVQAALLRCPYGIGLQPLDRFLAVADRFRHCPWPGNDRGPAAGCPVGRRSGSRPAHPCRHFPAAASTRPGLTRQRSSRRSPPARSACSPQCRPVPAAPAQSSRALDAILSRFTARMRPLCDLVGGLDARRGRRYPAAVAPAGTNLGIQGVRRCGGRATRVMSNRPCIWRPPGFPGGAGVRLGAGVGCAAAYLDRVIPLKDEAGSEYETVAQRDNERFSVKTMQCLADVIETRERDRWPGR